MADKMYFENISREGRMRTEVYALEQLVHERFDDNGVECATVSVGVHILLKIFVHVFEDEHKLILGVNDIVK